MLSLDALQARLARLDSTDALRQLFADWSYEVDFGSDIFLKQATKADERAQESLAKEPEIIARAGEFHIIYAPLKDWQRAIGAERLVISRLLNDHPFALWIFSDESATKWHFVNVKRGAGKGAAAMSRHVLRRFSFQKGETAGRTSIEQVRHIDVAALPVLPGMTPEALEIQACHDAAFDVEAVTLGFFRDYKMVFESVEKKVKIKDEGKRRLWTQRLFNRLMFLRFLEKKGWLEYDGDKNYLRALFKAAKTSKQSFLEDRLYFAFFYGLNRFSAIDEKQYQPIRGTVPFLNGGLFDLVDEYDARDAVELGNGAFEGIFDLFDRYNFTITESTPFDQEIGVDPEMLGKVFEELTNERTESGSYYTPRGVVSFMARESLKGYLQPCDEAAAIAKFVDQGDASALKRPRQVLQALEAVRVCDPACGSGAYLLGMMQELLHLREALFVAHRVDPLEIYDRKLEIIERNLYGADITEFATNIAMLRLWLSLVVDYNGSPDKLPALPNLGYKIARGDSLTAPNPTQLSLNSEQYKKRALELSELHKEWFEEGRKRSLGQAVRAKAKIKADIEAKTLQIQKLFGDDVLPDAHDWRVQFAEAFAHDGFDIVLANPPYGASVADATRTVYFPGESQSKDTYGLFMARGLQLLKPGGWFTYIVSDTWRTIKTHRPLRKRLVEQARVAHVIDLPGWIFNATVNTGILTFQKGAPDAKHALIAADIRNLPVGDWDGLNTQLLDIAHGDADQQTLSVARYTYPQSTLATYSNLSFFIAAPSLYALMSDKRFQPLGNVADVKHGLTTGDTREYVYKSATARGTYRIAEENHIFNLANVDHLSDEQRKHGIDEKKFSGQFLVPYDKGGASEVNEGWLPLYNVPTEYFIDWRKKSVDAMKRLKGFRHDGKDYFFQEGITFSHTGVYAPTFRKSCGGLFDTAGSCLFSTSLSTTNLLGLLNSTLVRYLFKSMVNHTVNAAEDPLKEIPIAKLSAAQKSRLEKLVSSIIEKQKTNARYDYWNHEQKQIDVLVYELYGLSAAQIREVEIWYCRRYPRLAQAQGVWDAVTAKYGL